MGVFPLSAVANRGRCDGNCVLKSTELTMPAGCDKPSETEYRYIRAWQSGEIDGVRLSRVKNDP